MYLTNRDKEILKFIESYGSLTISQCSKIFFKDCKKNYYQARRRLKMLSDNKYLLRYRHDMKSETIYYMDKKLSLHDLKVLDIYAELIHLGVSIRSFKREYIITLESKNYRVDGFVECIKNGYFYPILIEVDFTHFTSMKKLMDVYNSKYFQEKYKKLDEDIFPSIIIARPVFVQMNNNDLPFQLIYTDYGLANLNKIFT